MNWTEQHAAKIVKQAKARWGAAWIHLSPSQQRGEIAEGIVSLLMAQDEDHCSPLLLKLQKVAELASAEVK